MTELAHLVQDLRAHAHEAPAICAALMRRAARELEQRGDLVPIPALGSRQRVKGAPAC
jgi:hypothetical protein